MTHRFGSCICCFHVDDQPRQAGHLIPRVSPGGAGGAGGATGAAAAEPSCRVGELQCTRHDECFSTERPPLKRRGHRYQEQSGTEVSGCHPLDDSTALGGGGGPTRHARKDSGHVMHAAGGCNMKPFGQLQIVYAIAPQSKAQMYIKTLKHEILTAHVPVSRIPRAANFRQVACRFLSWRAGAHCFKYVPHQLTTRTPSRQGDRAKQSEARERERERERKTAALDFPRGKGRSWTQERR